MADMSKMLNFGIAMVLAILGVFIGLQILITSATVIFPLLVTAIVGLNTLGNFTFSSLFSASGLFVLILSAVILVACIVLPVAALYYAVNKLNMGGKR